MKTYEDSIDFITVVFKRIDYVKLIHESIKKYVDYPYKYYIVNNGDNSENSLELKKLNEMFGEDDNVVIVEGIHQVNQDDGVVVPTNANQKYPQEYFIDNYGWDGYSKYDKRPLGFASWLQSEAMTIGTKIGNGKYICQVEHDVVFLNKWVEHVLPMLEENSYVSYGWRNDIDIPCIPQWSILKRETIENNFYKEPGDLYPNCHYKDTYGLLSLWAKENNQPYIILKNSWNNRELKSEHLLNLSFGEEAWVNEVPFLHHGGRGATRSIDYYNEFRDEVIKYLELNVRKDDEN
ncbi:hypothetical protein HOE22_02840 [Candidatus Woesearchaeota archaeon]|jgi:hypothetical protein|nr:hypothetical protein [Candidatus Woesearchaeota archaeon]